MARNIELKARCADLDAAERVCRRLGACYQWTRRQVDTYFRVPDGRLKLREEEGAPPLLVRYHRSDGTAARDCQYTLERVPDARAAERGLAARHGVLLRVVKTRSLHLLGTIRIHLDRVEGLGTFLEFEAVMDPTQDDAETRTRLSELCQAFGIRDADRVAVSYADLLVAARVASCREQT